MKTGIELITLERARQIEREGWTAKHDDAHRDKEIALAAKDCLQSYLNGVGSYHPTSVDDKWRLGRKHNGSSMRLLMIAGALIAAEMDRLKRL